MANQRTFKSERGGYILTAFVVALLIALFAVFTWVAAVHPRVFLSKDEGPVGFGPGWTCETVPKGRICSRLPPPTPRSHSPP